MVLIPLTGKRWGHGAFLSLGSAALSRSLRREIRCKSETTKACVPEIVQERGPGHERTHMWHLLLIDPSCVAYIRSLEKELENLLLDSLGSQRPLLPDNNKAPLIVQP